MLIFFSAKFLVKSPKKISGLRPKNKGGPKIEKKRYFFGIKNVKNFESGIQRALCTKMHFSNGNHSKKKVQNSQNFQNFAKLFPKKKKSKKKNIKKYIYFFLGIIFFFFTAPAAPLFFSQQENEFP